MKKINDTKKKTKEILTLKQKNDQKFQTKMKEELSNQGKLQTNQNNN
eukprot:CAMPEP_0170542628 /NCGR_PEP_ID=MMETSP0211-20121228/2002_1 /TAXON_ID=311385 /ORGANISM="Pseudokeronopsis sp., Strain OXSARD2" /LENGTH=46 /DNA_ID= /DNA_START= /DNA_END= /DNA_ORIENTATION=